MTREAQRFAALFVTLLSGLAAYLIQPENITVWANPKLAGVVLGGLLVACPIINNFLSSMFADANTETQQRQRIRDLEQLLEERPADQSVTVNVPGATPKP